MSGFEEYLDSKTSVSSGGKSSTADNSNLKPFDIKIDKSKARDFDEAEFQSWYKGKAKQLNIDEDPDNPAHFYDYRAAYVAGAEPDNTGHWPSTFKMPGHPRMVVDGVNTKTGKKVDSSSSSFESFLDTKKPEVIAQPVVAKPEVKEKKGFISRIADTALQGAENISEAEGIAATHGGEALKTLGTGLAAMVPAVGSMLAPSAEGRKYATGFFPVDAVTPVIGRTVEAIIGKGKGKNPFQEAQDRLDRARGIAELFTVQPTTEEAKAAVEIISKPLSIIPELATESAEYYKKLGDAAEKKGDTKSASAWKALATTTDLGGEVLNFYVLGKVGKAPGKVAKTISDTTWYRKLTIKERALVTELDARISRGMTQDQHRNAVIRDKWKNGTEAEKNAIRNEMVFGIKPEAGERPISASGAGENLALPEHAYPSQDFVLRGPGSTPRDGLIGRSPGDDFVLRVNEQRPGLPALPPGVGNAAWYTNTERGIVPTDNHPVRQAVREAIAESQAKLPGPPNLGEGFTTKEIPSTAVIKRPSYSVPGPTTGLEVEYKPVVSKSGKPFPTEETAHIVAIDRGYKEGSFEVVPVEDGFGFRRIGTKPKMSNVAERTANTEKPSVQEVSKIDNMTDEVINESGSKYTLDLKGRKKYTQTKRWTNDYGKTWNEGYKVGDEFDLDRGGADVIAVETSVNAKGLSEESTKLIVSALIGEDGVVLEVVPKTNTSSKSSKTQKAADSSMTDEAKALGVEHTGAYEIPGREPVHSYFDPQTKGNFGVGKGETLEQAVKRHRDSFEGSSTFETFLDSKPKEVETSIPRVDKFIDNLPEGDVVMPENSIVYRGMDKNSKGNWWGDKIDAEAFASLREEGFVEPKDVSGKKLADADKFMKDADELGNSEIPTSLTTEGVNKLLDKVIEAGYDGIYSRKTKAILLPTDEQLARVASKKTALAVVKDIKQFINEPAKAKPQLEQLGKQAWDEGSTDWFKWNNKMKELLGELYKPFKPIVAEVWKGLKKLVKSQEGSVEGFGKTTIGEFINQRIVRKSEKSKLEKKAGGFKKVQDAVKKEIDDLSSPYGEKKFENLKSKRIADLEKEIKRLEEAKSFTKASTLKRAVTAVKQRNLNTHLAKLKRVDERFNSLIGKLNEKANATFDKEDVKAPQLKTADVEFLKKIPDMKWKPFGGFVENPIYSLEEWGRSVKGGEKKIKEMFVYPIREANKRAAEHFKSIHEKSQELEKSLPKGSSDRIGIYALSKDPEGVKVLEKMKMEVPELTPEELKAYNWMRRGFEVFHEKVNAGRKAAGLEPMGKVDNYFKLAAEISLAERLGFGLNDAYFNKYLHNKGTAFTSALERTGGLKKVRTDAFNIFNEYMQSATRHMYLSPETAKMREYFTKINLGKGKSIDIKDTHPVATKMVTEYLDFVVGQKKNIFPSGVESVIRFINDNNTIATLSASVRTPLVQPTALANTYAEIGPKYLKQGIAGLIDREWYDFAIKESDHLLTREFDVNITPTMSGAVGKVSRFRERFNKSWIGMKPTKFLDHASAVATWIGAYKKAIEVDGLAKGSKEAKQYADDVVIKTQGSAAKEDLAPIQRTNIGKFFTTFQTFVINNWNFLKKEVAGVKNSRISGAEGAHKTARILFAMTVINTLFEDVARINSPLPSPINAAMENYEETDSELKAATAAVLESLQIMPGVGNLRYGSTILGASPQLFSDLSTKVRAEYTGKGTGREKSWPELGGKVVGVPGTAQATRVAKILERGGSIPQAVIGDYPEDFKQTKKLFRKRFKNAVNAGNSAKANKIQEQANEWNRRVLSEGKPDQVIELE